MHEITGPMGTVLESFLTFCSLVQQQDWSRESLACWEASVFSQVRLGVPSHGSMAHRNMDFMFL